jgi:hypothetical protein
MEQIERHLRQLPPEKQSEVLDFVTFLQQRLEDRPARPRPLRQHSAFGSWQGRNIDALKYQDALRAEWDAEA